MRKLRIGSRVQLVTYKELRARYFTKHGKYPDKEQSLKLPTIYFVWEMRSLCGQRGTISESFGTSTPEVYYKIKFDKPRLDGERLFTKEMFYI